ncbi:uncharacterized protein LOC109805371 [Cajanus cajan]|uniref:uncharacterized protein LOC109805371 n=1 Tax=Cajanus cajan TaxID=3821 RepID=UPI00098DBB74|nr:uncharacterized protein LOC109805371 [Cajanus cajan]XP_020223015.1 uncharacterized protein LOC109805371 [Cajanus cajan]XP_020223016.1 uncharacterized protein LOC109805371 [Cajanus cajan]XP_020223018.1 uncharacterized protein LOC109805371 [Cajanus cajan]
MMHSVKSGWGKTFALAKHNESQGKKTRIRRSKEERKAMVESFIKKYQESNNGNFPSLNITHKEVGGSFYTVREIVRDIIQENRVLGPAKFTLEELNADHFFEQNPLGSIARDPQPLSAASSIENCSENDKLSDTNSKVISVSDGSYTEAAHQVVDNGHIISVGHVDVTNKKPIEVAVVADEHPMVDKGHTMNVSQVDVMNNESVKTAAVSDGCFTETEHKIVDKGHVLNGSQVNMINKESDEAAIPEVQVGDPTTLKQNVEQELKAATTPMAKVTAVADDLIVETFPLRSVSRTTDGIKNLGGLRDSSNSPENDIKTVELKQGVGKSELNGIEPSKNLNLLDEKFEDSHGNQILKNIPDTGLDKDENVGDMFEESSNHSTIEHFDHHGFEDHINPQARVSHQNTITYGTVKQGHMMDGAKTSTQINNISKTYKPSEEDGGLLKTDIHRVDGQHGGNSQRSSNTTVDRINLESWDGATKNSARRESNPFLAVLKVLADAFVKFWSG